MADSKKAIASLSLDLDNLWSYLKTHGDPSWQAYPSYLGLVVPRLLDFFSERDQLLTFFVVGQDASMPRHRELLQQIVAAGHEIGNHSFSHEPWFHLYSRERVVEEIAATEEAIEDATGVRPEGFRGPGYSLSTATLEVLEQRGYRYDCSTLPTFLGPLSRWYYFRTSKLDQKQKEERARLFGGLREGLRPLGVYRWMATSDDPSGLGLIEIPVTTAPVVRTPIHCSYLLYLSRYSQPLARLYLRTAIRMCRASGLEPSLLLHPLDFLGGEDVSSLAFFPAMELSTAAKLRRMSEYLDVLASSFEVVTMSRHAELASHRNLPRRRADFQTSAIPESDVIEHGQSKAAARPGGKGA